MLPVVGQTVIALANNMYKNPKKKNYAFKFCCKIIYNKNYLLIPFVICSNFELFYLYLLFSRLVFCVYIDN